MSIPNSLTLSSPDSPPGAIMSSEPAFQPGCELFTHGLVTNGQTAGDRDPLLCADGPAVGRFLPVPAPDLLRPDTPLLCSTALQEPSDRHSLHPVLFSGWTPPREVGGQIASSRVCSWRFPDMLVVSAAQLGILPLARRVSGPHCGGEGRRHWDC